MHPLGIKCSGLEVLDSRSFIALGEDEVVVELGSLKVILQFKSEKETTEAIRMTVQDEKTAVIECINWNNPLGTVTTKPIELGLFSRRKLHIGIHSSSIGSNDKPSSRVVVVTAYLGEPVPNAGIEAR